MVDDKRAACDHSCFAGGQKTYLRHVVSWPHPFFSGSRGRENSTLEIDSLHRVLGSWIAFSFAAIAEILGAIGVCFIFLGIGEYCRSGCD